MDPLQTVPELLDSYPALVLLLGFLARAILAWQAELSWYEYRTLHGCKRLLFPTLDRLEPMGFGLFVTEKRGTDDDEYLLTTDAGIKRTVNDLRRSGANLHLLSSIKRRPEGNGDPYSRAHLVWTDGSDQTECYVFKNSDGGTDVYAHTEASVTNPKEHLEGATADGDPSGRIKQAL